MNELCWLPLSDSEDKAKVLHWRTQNTDNWKPYWNHPLRQPDYGVPFTRTRSSSGFSTAQYLLNRGWKYVPSQIEDDRDELPQTFVNLQNL